MRLAPFAALALPILLAACSSSTPPTPVSSAAPGAAQPMNVAAPANDDALKPLFGTWALDPTQCTGPVLKISKTRFEGGDTGCDISGYADNGDGTYTASVTCSGTAEQIKMRPIFAPTGEGIDLTYLNRKNLASEVLRCEAAN